MKKNVNQFSFNWKYKEFEIRTQTSYRTGLPYLELVKWHEDHKTCFVLAFYNWDKEGGRLQFVGNRPLEEISELDIGSIWKQLWLTCKMLQDWYEKEYDNIHT